MFMLVFYNGIGCYVVGGRRGCVGRGCAGVGGYGRGVGVVAVFQRLSHIFTRTSVGLAKETRSLSAT